MEPNTAQGIGHDVQAILRQDVQVIIENAIRILIHMGMTSADIFALFSRCKYMSRARPDVL
jgi:adenylosuccinate lyase